MIAVVTGSTGFIGSHLVDTLLAQGATVRALYRPETSPARRDPRVAAYEADLLDDRSLRESSVWRGATHVFHVAGLTRGRTLERLRDGNVFPTVNLFAALAGQSGTPPRTVLVSSQAASSPAPAADRPIRETDRPIPVEAYGRSKLQAEQAVVRYRDTLPITVVRPAAVYGPRDRDFLAAFRQASGRVAIHAAPADHLFSIVHVHDLVTALIAAGTTPDTAGRTYFIANAEPVSWRQLYAHISTAAGSHPNELQLPLAALRVAAGIADVLGAVTGFEFLLNGNKVALASPRWWLCDASLARNELGWSPAIPLQAGIRETYLWYLAEGWLRAPKLSGPVIKSTFQPM